MGLSVKKVKARCRVLSEHQLFIYVFYYRCSLFIEFVNDSGNLILLQNKSDDNNNNNNNNNNFETKKYENKNST